MIPNMAPPAICRRAVEEPSALSHRGSGDVMSSPKRAATSSDRLPRWQCPSLGLNLSHQLERVFIHGCGREKVSSVCFRRYSNRDAYLFYRSLSRSTRHINFYVPLAFNSHALTVTP